MDNERDAIERETGTEATGAVDPLVMRDIPDAPDWVSSTCAELREIGDWFERRGNKDNARFQRMAADMLEVLAGAYETAKRRAE